MVRKLHKNMGNISTKDLLYMIDKILIPNFLINRDDLKAANENFGTSNKALKGKTLRKPGECIQLEIEIISFGFLYHYKNVTLTSDIMFVNKIRHFITISRHIQFGTAEVITDAKTSTLIQSVVNVNIFYNKRGFHISLLHVDGQFDTSRIIGVLSELNVTLNPVS